MPRSRLAAPRAPQTRARIGSVAIACACASAPSLASAQTRASASLEYTVSADASGCPDRAAFIDAVAARLGYVPFYERAERRVHVAIAKGERGYRGTLTLEGGRTLESRSCAELADALAVAAAIGLDPDAIERPTVAVRPEQTPSAPLDASEPTESAVAPHAAEAPSPPNGVSARDESASVAPASARAVNVGAIVGAFATGGDLPAPSFGGSLGFELSSRRFRAVAEGSYAFPATVRIGEGGRGAASVAHAQALVGGCALHARFFGCATAAGGALLARGEGLDRPRDATSPTIAVGVRLGYEHPLSARLALRLQGDVLAPLVKSTVVVDGNPLWTSDGVSGRLSLALRVALY
jgi:hypothetical protein